MPGMKSTATREKGIDPAVIEPGILPVCEALNALPEVRTLWSCEGHWGRQLPYAGFQATADMAEAINRAVSRAGSYCWWVVGMFDPEGVLRFSLRPNDYRLHHGIGGWLHMRRQNLDAELLRLATAIIQLRQSSN